MILHPAFILLLMLFLHIVDDYYLQGWLASAKQKKWWEKNAPDKLYNKDYIMALCCHAFSWSFMIMLPIALATNWDMGWLFLAYPINMGIHAFIDDMKANKLKINLIIDQSFHFIQILSTWLIWYLTMGLTH